MKRCLPSQPTPFKSLPQERAHVRGRLHEPPRFRSRSKSAMPGRRKVAACAATGYARSPSSNCRRSVSLNAPPARGYDLANQDSRSATGITSPSPSLTYQAHHIVARSARAAEGAKEILRQHGIKVSDAVNGVFLPAAQHARMHTNEYYRQVERFLREAKSRDDAIRILRDMARRLSESGHLALVPPFINEWLRKLLCP
jgi:hypothetical protein